MYLASSHYPNQRWLSSWLYVSRGASFTNMDWMIPAWISNHRPSSLNFLYLCTENYNSCITRKPVHYTSGPALAGQCRPGIGPRRFASDRSGIGSGALRHARMGIKNKSNDDKTSLVALLTYLLHGGGICASGQFALANISTGSTSAEDRELSWCRPCRRWWHRRLSKWQPPMPRVAAGWHRGDSLSFSA